MRVPAYLLFFLGMLILLVMVCIIYYRIYKRTINRALTDTSKKHKAILCTMRSNNLWLSFYG